MPNENYFPFYALILNASHPVPKVLTDFANLFFVCVMVFVAVTAVAVCDHGTLR